MENQRLGRNTKSSRDRGPAVVWGVADMRSCLERFLKGVLVTFGAVLILLVYALVITDLRIAFHTWVQL